MTASGHDAQEARLQEIEIRAAFLERELDLYKEAVQDLHARLEAVEHRLARLQRVHDAAGEGVFPELPEKGAEDLGGAGTASGFPGVPEDAATS